MSESLEDWSLVFDAAADTMDAFQVPAVPIQARPKSAPLPLPPRTQGPRIHSQFQVSSLGRGIQAF